MAMLYAIMIVCFSSTALAQVAGWGACPKVETMSDFDVLKIEGTWYESRRYFTTFEVAVKCVKSDFKHSGNGTMLLDSSAIYRLSGHLGVINGIVVRVADPAEPGKLIVKFPSADAWGNYWVLGSDYKSYIVGYTCLDLEFVNLKYLWISTRDQNPSDAVIDEAISIIEKQGLDKDILLVTDQEDCEIKP